MPDLKKATQEKTYRQILLDSRKEQLRLSMTNVRRLEITFDAAVERIRQRVEALPTERIGTPWYRAQFQLMAEIRNVIDAFDRDNGNLLEVGMLELSQNAAEREVEVAKLVQAPIDSALLPQFSESVALTNGQIVPVRFGRLALGAVERVTTRYYRDGLKLSDRLHNLSVRQRKIIEDTITQGIVEQLSARDLAKRVQVALADLAPDGKPPPRHVAQRIAVTEINNSHREAHAMSTQSSPGQLKEYISGIRWNLSSAHVEADVCDLYASRDAGLGPGIYLPSEFPVSHPWCRCFSTTVLKEFPDSGIGGAKPDPDNVPDSQRRRFNEEFGVPVGGELVAV